MTVVWLFTRNRRISVYTGAFKKLFGKAPARPRPDRTDFERVECTIRFGASYHERR